MDAHGPEQLRRPASPLLLQSEERLFARAGFALACPPLAPASAVCAAFTIPWERAQALHSHALAATLPDEHARAARFLRPEDALRHLLGRALLRRLAAACAGTDPRQPLSVPAGGKPFFEGSAFDASISHGGDQVWVALAHGAQAGIDVERELAVREAAEVTASLHPAETAAIHADVRPERATLRCWTRKEAVTKAVGQGLALPLHAYCVDTGPVPAGWLRVPPPGTAQADWTTLDLEAAPGHGAALALHGPCHAVRVLQLQWLPED